MENSIQGTKLAQLLQRRSARCTVSAALYGAIQPIVYDITPFLEYIKKSFPSYTDHGIHHSIRIIQRISGIIPPRAMQELSSCEIFALILAALFHDTGMVAPDSITENSDNIRATHHLRSRQIVVDYLESKLSLLPNRRRLAEVIGFVVESHGLDWSTMFGREEFILREKIFEQVVRTPILAILLRIGDLLDLDSDRTSSLCLDRCRNWINVPGSLDHHERHQCVRSFYYDSREIKLWVQCKQRTQHQLWEQWISYLRQDIELANTYVFRDGLAVFQLPVPDLRVERSPDALYELWPLRFEIDNDGALWEILRQSLYTGRLDFVREVIQNAIDAGLRRLYDKNSSQLVGHSPRSWSNATFQPLVMVIYMASEKRILVSDNGIGMSILDLENFLFLVAKSGVKGARGDRDFPFPSIAMFGVGFTSVLTRAKQVVITTRKADEKPDAEALQVQLNSAQREAYLERALGWPEGTSIQLDVGLDLKFGELGDYLSANLNYTAVPVHFLDFDALKGYAREALNLMSGQKADLPSVDFARLGKLFAQGEVQRALSETDTFLSEIGNQASNILNSRDVIDRGLAQRLLETPLPLVKLGGNALPVPPLNDALFVSLDGALNIRSVFHVSPGQPLTLSDARLGLLFVPVRFVDHNRGLEWCSVHAFVVESGAVHRVAAVVRRSGDTYCTLSSRDLRFSDEEWDERTVSEIAGLKHIRQEVLITEPAGIVHSRYFSWRGSDIFDLTRAEPDFSRPFKPEAYNREAMRFSDAAFEWFKDKRREVFQDGIRLPLGIESLACVGATVGNVNLTAAARFHLNIPRNAVDLTPSFIANWQRTTGRLICETIAEAVANALDGFGLIFDWSLLWVDTQGGVLLNHRSEWAKLHRVQRKRKAD